MKQLLCYGDSNTWGLIPGTQQRYPWGIRWTSILQEKLESRKVRVIEEGLCGRTTVFEDACRENRNGLKTLPLVLETHAPIDGVVIMLGTNDCKSFYHLNADQITIGMEQCIDSLLTVIPGNHILLVSPIYLGEKVWKPGFDPEFDQRSVEVVRELQFAYRKLAAQKGIRMLAASDFAIPSEIDQQHMTPEGHAALAEAICANIQAMNSHEPGNTIECSGETV